MHNSVKSHRFRYHIKAAIRSHVICSPDRQQNAWDAKYPDGRASFNPLLSSPLYSKCVRRVSLRLRSYLLCASWICRSRRRCLANNVMDMLGRLRDIDMNLSVRDGNTDDTEDSCWLHFICSNIFTYKQLFW